MVNKVAPTVFSLKAQVPLVWPIADRFGSIKMMVYMDPQVNGVMIVAQSHPEDKKEFFGTPLPETPQGCVRINIHK
jgi:hypothetical protein